MHLIFEIGKLTSSDSLCTSVTNHQAKAHPPTLVVLDLDPQQPPEKNKQTLKISSNRRILTHYDSNAPETIRASFGPTV